MCPGRVAPLAREFTYHLVVFLTGGRSATIGFVNSVLVIDDGRNIRSLVSRVPLLAQLDARDVARIMPLLQAHNLPPNVEIVSAGSPGTAMFFIAAGRVRARGSTDEQEYATGDFFGDVAMIENELNRASYVTCAKCRLLKLHKEDFAQLEAASPTIASQIREVAAARLAQRTS